MHLSISFFAMLLALKNKKYWLFLQPKHNEWNNCMLDENYSQKASKCTHIIANKTGEGQYEGLLKLFALDTLNDVGKNKNNRAGWLRYAPTLSGRSKFKSQHQRKIFFHSI